MKIAACYIRVSTDDQLEYSPDSQLEAIRRYAKQNDYILPEEFVFIEHDGISGRNAKKREEFQRMIGTAKLKPKPFDTLLLWKFSRFARNREDSIVYKSMLRKQCGIDVVSISEPIGDDKMSVIFEAMIEAMDEYYSINLAEEVRRGMTERAKRGECNTIAPFGYAIRDKKLIIVPDKAEIIREVFRRYVNGESQRSIALWLNDIGIRTKRGNVIENRTIDYWLNNPVYHGFVRWTPTGRTRRDFRNPDSLVVKGDHEPIISEEVWEAAQARIAETKKKYSRYARSAPSDSFILSGIVKCAVCGAPYAKSTSVYMQCSGYSHAKCVNTQSARIEDIYAALIAGLAADVQNLTFPISERKKSATDSSAAKIIDKAIEREETKLSRAKQAYLDGIDTAEEYKANKAAINAEIERLRAERSKTLPDTHERDTAAYSAAMRDRVNTLIDLLSSDASNADKNAALKSIIEKVIYNKADKSLTIFYHDL